MHVYVGWAGSHTFCQALCSAILCLLYSFALAFHSCSSSADKVGGFSRSGCSNCSQQYDRSDLCKCSLVGHLDHFACTMRVVEPQATEAQVHSVRPASEPLQRPPRELGPLQNRAALLLQAAPWPWQSQQSTRAEPTETLLPETPL